MNTYTLKLFNTGQITLPKHWREKFKTKHFLAKETKDGLLIQPIKENENVVEYDNKNEEGLIFPKGINPQKLMDKIKEIDE